MVFILETTVTQESRCWKTTVATPPVLKDHIFLPERPTAQYNWACQQRPPVIRCLCLWPIGWSFKTAFTVQFSHLLPPRPQHKGATVVKILHLPLFTYPLGAFTGVVAPLDTLLPVELLKINTYLHDKRNRTFFRQFFFYLFNYPKHSV